MAEETFEAWKARVCPVFIAGETFKEEELTPNYYRDELLGSGDEAAQLSFQRRALRAARLYRHNVEYLAALLGVPTEYLDDVWPKLVAEADRRRAEAQHIPLKERLLLPQLAADMRCVPASMVGEVRTEPMAAQEAPVEQSIPEEQQPTSDEVVGSELLASVEQPSEEAKIDESPVSPVLEEAGLPTKPTVAQKVTHMSLQELEEWRARAVPALVRAGLFREEELTGHYYHSKFGKFRPRSGPGLQEWLDFRDRAIKAYELGYGNGQQISLLIGCAHDRVGVWRSTARAVSETSKAPTKKPKKEPRAPAPPAPAPAPAQETPRLDYSENDALRALALGLRVRSTPKSSPLSLAKERDLVSKRKAPGDADPKQAKTQVRSRLSWWFAYLSVAWQTNR